ncbi:MAG TPA: HEAT repeat domain-containing protein [Thermoanaerobaculia bacterium]|nr:HEAT repeat domain-containing protein [Thermoanaerobaculia bacterium]
MRRLLAVLLVAGCTTAATPPPPPAPAAPPQPYGFTTAEEAQILRFEDRREYDPAVFERWVHHPNSLHRARIALALGRIGPSTVNDRNAVLQDLTGLANDGDPGVRVNAAFALGQVGDVAATDTLLQLAADRNDADVAAEAVEGLSKLAPRLPLAPYARFTEADQREGVRARAIEYLFRFRSDDASNIAANALDSPSPIIHEVAAYALARRAFAPARAKLQLLINDPDVLTRSYAARALGGIAAAESLPVLVGALADPHPWVRTNALAAIARVVARTPALASSTDDAVRVVAMTEDPDPGTRASAIDPLGDFAVQNEIARKRLLEIATSGSRWERELAAGAIAKHFDDEKLLPPNLTDWAKVRVLEAASPLSDRLRRQYANDPEPLVRQNAMSTIPDEKVNASLDLIRAALGDPDVIVRGYAIDRDAKSNDVNRLAALTAAEERARRDPQDDARLAAIRGLAEIDFPGREAFLRGLLQDNDPVVRRVASDLIAEKLHEPRPNYTPLPVDRSDYAQIVEWSRQPHTATIHMTRGPIRIVLLTQDAPITTWNFAQLAKQRFFDNTSFMRVVPNFVIQGGDPRNDMEGGPGYAIRDEINLQKYTRGAVGMALSGPDTGGSQFFITHSPQPHLDGGYTIFGRVTDGMNAVVDQTERGDRVETIAIDER